MSKTIYNEGRVVGLSAYEEYVRQKLIEDPNALPASNREWLASSLGLGSSMLVKIPVASASQTGRYYIDIPFPVDSKLGAANTIVASYFNGEGVLLDTANVPTDSTSAEYNIINYSSLSTTVEPMKHTFSLDFRIPGYPGVHLTDANNLNGELFSNSNIHLTDLTGSITKTFSGVMGGFQIPDTQPAIKGTLRLYNTNARWLYDDGNGNLIDSGDNEQVGRITYSNGLIHTISFTSEVASLNLIRYTYESYVVMSVSGSISYPQHSVSLQFTSLNDVNQSIESKYKSGAISNVQFKYLKSVSIAASDRYWAKRVSRYGHAIANEHIVSPQDGNTFFPSTVLPDLVNDPTNTEMKQMMNYLRISEALILQPGKWTHISGIDNPYKDFTPDRWIYKPAILRIYFLSPVTESFWLLLTGFTDKDVVIGESDMTTAIDTRSSENGDFLGPACYPWAAKVVVTTPTNLTYYLKNGIKSHTDAENTEIEQSEDTPVVTVKVYNRIDRGSKSAILDSVKQSSNANRLPENYTGQNVYVGQSDGNFAKDTIIGVKNKITSETSNTKYTNEAIHVEQSEDGGSTEITVNPGAVVNNGTVISDGNVLSHKMKDGKLHIDGVTITAGAGINLNQKLDTNELEIINAVVDSNLQTLTKGVDYDIYWFNGFNGGRYEDSPVDDYVGIEVNTSSGHLSEYTVGDLHITSSIAKNKDTPTAVNVAIDASHSRDACLIHPGEYIYGTGSSKVYVGEALAYKQGNSLIENISMGHSKSIVERPESCICFIEFKGNKFKDVDLSNSAFKITSGSSTGIWNMNSLDIVPGLGDRQRGSKFGGSWESSVSCSLVNLGTVTPGGQTIADNIVHRMNVRDGWATRSAAAGNMRTKIGLMLTWTSYADGYNRYVTDILNTAIAKSPDKVSICLHSYANLHIAGIIPLS